MTQIANKVANISSKKLLADFYEDNGIKQQDIDESLLMKWIDDKAGDVISDRNLIHQLDWLDVNNYKATLPKNLSIINEISYKVKKSNKSCQVKGYELTQYVEDVHGCKVEYNVDCPKCHIPKDDCGCAIKDVSIEINRSFEIAHPEMFYSKYASVGSFGYGYSVYSEKWRILPHSSSDYFGIKKHLPECANLHVKECPDSYVINPPVIETSFEKGELLISYMGIMRDEDGFLMIPDHRDVFEAILQYLTYKWYRREYLMRRDGSDKGIYQEAKFLCDEATNKAIARLSMPSFQEVSRVWSNNQWSKIDSAYTNYLNGGKPIETISKERRNPYKS